MINEVTKSFQDSVKERVSSPLLGSFILFLLAFNYKVIIIFFSSGTVAEKLESLPPFWGDRHSLYLGDGSTNLILTIGFTILFVYVYPIISNKIYEYWDNKRAERRKKQREHLSSEINHMKEVELDHFKRQLLEDEFHFNEILTEKNSLIDEQKAKLDELKKIAGNIYPVFEYDEETGLPYKPNFVGKQVFFCPTCLAGRKAIPLLNDTPSNSKGLCPICKINYQR